MIAVIFAARLAVSDDHDGAAFAASAIAIAALVGSIFINLYPNVMVSSTNARLQPDRQQLRVGLLRPEGDDDRRVIFFPLVLAYQGWSFHVFRARVKAPPDARCQRPAPPAAIGRRLAPHADVHPNWVMTVRVAGP